VFHFLWSTYFVETRDLSDVSVVHAPFAAGQGSLALFTATLTGKPLWITSHAYDLYCDRIALKAKLSSADLFVTISNENASWLRSRYGALAEKVRVNYLGIEPSEYAYSAPRPVSGHSQVVSVGSLNPKKGHDDLIRAVGLLREQDVDVALTIIGEGPERGLLENLIEETGLSETVQLVGSLPNDEVLRLVGRADAFALACRPGLRGDKDGIPVALMEAMAIGVVCVSTRISGIPELVKHRETGLLSEPADVPGIAEALREALQNDALRASLSRAARHHVELHFDQTRNVRELALMVRGAALRQ
jgi:glycosyltransferase involved in cell wall biosynthesis